ncbi:MAG: hypothetical protein DRP93_04990 [Candidatus Neomarinimicrobiota bacterium]|nr:MAG: hypothetical protein DRP93_04990 [Candidatus Neomarinimicrobiota bacterium]
MQEQQYYNEKWSFVIKWIAVILLVILLLVIFIPNNIWKDEYNMRHRSHWKMEQLWDAQRMYHKLTGYYDADMKGVLWFVSAVRDSILADSEYIGNQIIKYKGENIAIQVPEFWFTEYDTVFSNPYNAKDTSLVSVFTAVEYNGETGIWDTVYLGENKDRYKYTDTLWEGVILDTTIDTIIEKVIKYKHFNLVDSLLVCPLTNKEYKVTVKGKESDTVIINSPIRDGYKDRIYLFFTIKVTGRGFIMNGEASWNK